MIIFCLKFIHCIIFLKFRNRKDSSSSTSHSSPSSPSTCSSPSIGFSPRTCTCRCSPCSTVDDQHLALFPPSCSLIPFLNIFSFFPSRLSWAYCSVFRSCQILFGIWLCCRLSSYQSSTWPFPRFICTGWRCPPWKLSPFLPFRGYSPSAFSASP